MLTWEVWIISFAISVIFTTILAKLIMGEWIWECLRYSKWGSKKRGKNERNNI